MVGLPHLTGFARCIGLSRNVRRDRAIRRHAAILLRQNALLAILLWLLYPSAAKADSGASNASMLLLLLLLFAGLLLLYLLPSIIAFRSGHPNRWVIFALNVFLGSTVIVWVGCLIWANKAVHLSQGPPESGGTDGGESGLNIFANDEKKVRLVSPEPIFTHSTREIRSDIPTQLSKLKELLDGGLISRREFDDLKRKIITSARA